MSRRLVEWMRRFPRWALFTALAASASLGLLSLPVGYFLDDHVHRYAVAGFPGPMGPWTLFDFASGNPDEMRWWIEHGPFPWWTEPNLRLAFFRPLSSALTVFDLRVLGDHPKLHHLHSALWGVALVGAASLVFRRLGAPVVSAVALLLFALDESHFMPVGWLANRNALVAAVPAILAFAAHLKWRLDGWHPAALLSALGLAVALCGGESALGILAYFVAFEVTSADGWRARLLGLLPTGSVALAYLVFYRLGGYGAQGSGLYLDPSREPAAYLSLAWAKALGLVGCLGLNFPVDLWMGVPSARPALVGLGLGTVILFAWLLRAVRRSLLGRLRRLHDVFLLGALGSMVPALAIVPAARLLLLPSLGAAALLALVARHLWQERRPVLLWLLITVHVPVAVFTWVASLDYLARVGRVADWAAAHSELGPRAPQLRVIVLSSPDAPSFLYLPLMRTLGGYPSWRDWWILSHAPLAQRLTRTGPASFELEALGGSFLDGDVARVVRSTRPFAAGDEVGLDGAKVTVVGVEEGQPRRLRFELDEPLESEDVRVVAWRDGALRRQPLPAVGETIALPLSPGVFRMVQEGAEPR